MGKTSLAGASLVVALPGAVLTYLILMAVLGSFEPMPTVLKVAAILTLVVAAAMALFPGYVLIWYGGKSAVKERPQTAGGAAAPEDESEMAETEAFLGEDRVEAEEQVDDESPGEETFDDDGLEGLDEIDDDLDASGEEPVFEEEMDSDDDFDEQFEFEEFEEFEEEK